MRVTAPANAFRVGLYSKPVEKRRDHPLLLTPNTREQNTRHRAGFLLPGDANETSTGRGSVMMLELFGIPISPSITTGNVVTWLFLIFGGALIWWIRGMPARKLADNEGQRVDNEIKIAAAAELADRFRAWRQEVHELKNSLAKVAAEQIKCGEALADAHTLNRRNKDQMNTMLFIIRLLISELKRLDPDSVIVMQAEATMAHMNGHDDPTKSSALVAAEHTLDAAKETIAEVKHSEGEK